MSTTVANLVIHAEKTVFPDGVRPATIVIKGERIVAVEPFGTPVNADKEFTIPQGQMLMPGLLDSHVHVNEPGRTQWEGYESATRAALAGGITTILDMPLNSDPPTVDVDKLELKRNTTAGKLSVDVGFWGGAVPGNKEDLAALWEKGVFGFKCFTAHSGIDEYGCLPYGEIEEDLEEISRLGAVMIVHAEDPEILAGAPQKFGPRYADYLA